jgi:hypothetical protein
MVGTVTINRRRPPRTRAMRVAWTGAALAARAINGAIGLASVHFFPGGFGCSLFGSDLR